MKEKELKVIAVSDPMKVFVPADADVGIFIPVDMIDAEEIEGREISIIFDFTDDWPDYNDGKDWWHADDKGMVHVQFAEELRQRYIELMDKAAEEHKLTDAEDKELQKIDALLDQTSRAAASEAIKAYGEKIYNAIKTETPVDSNQEKKEYRTQAKAGSTAEMPTHLAVITDSNYKNATNLVQKGDAFLQPMKDLFPLKNGLSYNNETGAFMINGIKASTATLKMFKTKEIPENLDLPFLNMCYTILLMNYQAQILQSNAVGFNVEVYYPALAKVLGKQSNISRLDVESFIASIGRFNNIVGVIDGEYQPVLLYVSEDREKNTITFSSPYLVKVIRKLYHVSLKKDKKGNIRKKSNGKPLMKPSNSYLAKASITKERSKAAVENVFLILYTIEKAGDHIPHIKISTLIENNPILSASLKKQKKARDKNIILKRTFKKTWELLRTQTELENVYKNIKLPDPNDPATIPTSSTLEMVIEFPHEGKKKKK